MTALGKIDWAAVRPQDRARVRRAWLASLDKPELRLGVAISSHRSRSRWPKEIIGLDGGGHILRAPKTREGEELSWARVARRRHAGSP
jgi:hypothetical protein